MGKRKRFNGKQLEMNVKFCGKKDEFETSPQSLIKLSVRRQKVCHCNTRKIIRFMKHS